MESPYSIIADQVLDAMSAVSRRLARGGVRHLRALTGSVFGHKHPSRRRKVLPASVSYWRPIFMSSRDFAFEMAICDCRSSALMK